MIRTVLLLMGALLIGCERQDPRRSDAERERLHVEAEEFRSENPGITKACLEQMRSGKGPAWPEAREGCFEMQPAKRWRGLWNAGWEWSNFCPEPAHECPIADDVGDVWLEFADPASEPVHPDGVFEIEFIGRRTRDTGHFAHQGLYDHTILVDQLISIRPVEVPWPPAEQAKRP